MKKFTDTAPSTPHAPASAPPASDQVSSVSVDPAEMESFSRMAEDWWNPDGMFKPLHLMNGFRLGYIKDTLCTAFDRDPKLEQPLKGLRILDIGCGGGLLCEPMTRLGADVTGVDALERNVKTAKAHSEAVGLDIDYRHGTIEAMVEGGEAPFDAVLNMEVIEHVVAPSDFIANCAALVRPGGLMICSTINRTLKAFAFAIVGAEYVLRWLPRGTHQYEKLVKPRELTHWLSRAGLSPRDPIGASLNPISQTWSFSSDVSINYMITASKP